MRKISLRSVSVLMLAVLLFTSVLAAGCGNKNAPESTTSSEKATEASTGEQVRLPEKADAKYDGYDFMVLIASRSSRTPDDFTVKENDTTVMSKAVYDRNSIMLEDHGIIIKTTVDLSSANNGYGLLAKDYLTATGAYDLGIINTYSVCPLTTGGYLYDMEKVPYLNLENPWWDATVTNSLNIAGSVYFTSGNISTTVDDYTYAVIFNKSLYKTYITDGTDVYSLVREGKWTLDQLARLSSGIKEDLNADDKFDSRDRYGLMTWCDECLASVQAAGERVAFINDDGYVELSLYNERVVSIVEKFQEIESSDWCINFQTMTGGVAWMDCFKNNQVLFLMSLLNEVSRFRDMDTDYGILPNPKFEEEQEDYYCSLSAGLASFVCLPGVQEDIERTGAVTELLGYYGMKHIKPAYYEKTLVGYLIRDDESSVSLDTMFARKWVDIGHYFQVGSINVAFYEMIFNGRIGQFTSMYQSKLQAMDTAIRDINNQILKLQERD